MSLNYSLSTNFKMIPSYNILSLYLILLNFIFNLYSPDIIVQIFKYLVMNLDNKSLIDNSSFSIKNILLNNVYIFLEMREDLIKCKHTRLKKYFFFL